LYKRPLRVFLSQICSDIKNNLDIVSNISAGLKQVYLIIIIIYYKNHEKIRLLRKVY